MAFCFQNPNATIPGTHYTCAQALSNTFTLIQNLSYLRPNTGGALLPWIYTVIIILIHIPVVLIRVVRWEVVQAWSIFFAVFTIIVVTQSYVSTQFDPAKILIWTPVILVIDAGSMIQVFFLVIEAQKFRLGPRIFLVDPSGRGQKDNESNVQGTQKFSSLLTRFRRRRQGPHDQIALKDRGSQSPERRTPAPPQNAPTVSGSTPEAEDLCWYKDPAVWSAFFAALSFIAVVALQVLGLVKAAQAIRPDPPLVEWCSPLLQPFGITALDGDGHAYTIIQDSNKGIGCIEIPGVWQRSWVKGTVAVTALELVFELFDTIILMTVGSSTRWREVKMKRPWFTIFLGMIVLLVTLICGIFFAGELPPEITKNVTVIMESNGIVGNYEIVLTNSGLRGAVIGWSDGLFESWRTTYFGG